MYRIITEDKQLITNDRFYNTDTDGNILYSQGGGIFKFPMMINIIGTAFAIKRP